MPPSAMLSLKAQYFLKHLLANDLGITWTGFNGDFQAIWGLSIDATPSEFAASLAQNRATRRLKIDLHGLAEASIPFGKGG